MEFSALAFVSGVACGFLGGAPYIVALAIAKKRRDASILPALVAACVSIVVIALSVLVVWNAAPAFLFVFAIALMVAFLATAVASVVMYGRKPRP